MMNVLRNILPEVEELVGLDKQLEKLEKCIKEKKPCILYGSAGIGKTSSVYAIAKKLGYGVVEINASDERSKEQLQELYHRVRMKTFRPVIFLFDEADGIKHGSLVAKIVRNSNHPIVFTANELRKIPVDIRMECVEIKYYEPQILDVLKRVKSIAEEKCIKIKYDHISKDVRSSINTALFNADKYKSETYETLTEKIFRGKPIDRLDSKLMIWLIDNVHRFYSGRKLFEAIEILCLVDITRKKELLMCLPKGKRKSAIFPYFFRRVGRS